MTLQWLFALSTLAASCVYAFPNGAPIQACGDMVPQHGVGAQNGTGGYMLDVTKTSDPEGVKCYHVELRGDGKAFKGFFMQARKIESGAPSSDQELLGSFTVLDKESTQERICGGATEVNGVTHTSNSDKQSVQVLWYPHGVADLEGVKIIATVVESKDKFWVGVRKGVES